MVDRETGTEVALGCNLVVGGDAFGEEKDVRYPSCIIPRELFQTDYGALKGHRLIQ